jgi:TP901 family phage tail tape measure protein
MSSKILGLSIVFGAVTAGLEMAVGKAIKDIDGVGKTVDKLNKKKIALVDADVNVSKINSKIQIVNGAINDLVAKKAELEIKLKTAKTKDEAAAVSKSIESIDAKVRSLNSYEFKLIGKLEAARAKAEETNKSVAKIGSTIEAINKHKLNIEASIANRDNLKSQMVDKIALGSTIVAPMKVAIDFESSMADVKKVVNFANEIEFKGFEKNILSLSRTIPLSATELATITASGGQLGIAKDNLLDFTTIVAKMSTAFDMSADKAGDSIAKLMNVYGLNMKDAEKLGDAINHLSDSTAAKASDMVEALGRIGGTAKIFGLNTIQASALSSAFLSLGKSPEVAATSINALLSKLGTADKQGGKFKDALKEIGYDAKGLKDAIDKDANAALGDFLRALSKVDKKEQLGVMSDLFGAEYADDIALLTGSLNVYEDALKSTANAQTYAGSMQKEFKNRSETTANNLKLLRNNVVEIGISLGNIFLPALNAIITPIRVVGSAISDLMDSSPIIGGAIKVTAGLFAGFVTLSVAGAGLAYALTFLSGGFSKVLLFGNLVRAMLMGFSFQAAIATTKTVVFGAVQRATAISSVIFTGALNVLGGALSFVGKAVVWLGRALMMNPIGLAVMAIAGAAFAIYTYWEPIKGFFSRVWNSVLSVFGQAWTAITGVLGFNPIGIVMQSWEGIKTYFINLWQGLIAGFVKTFEKVGEMWGSVKSFLGFGDDKDTKKTVKLTNNTQNIGSEIFKKDVKVTESKTVAPVIKPIAVSDKGYQVPQAKPVTLSEPKKQSIKPANNTDQESTGGGSSAAKKTAAAVMIGGSLVAAPQSMPANTTQPKAHIAQAAQTVKEAKTPQQYKIDVTFTGDIIVKATDGKVVEAVQLKSNLEDQVRVALARIKDSAKNRSFEDEVI